MSDETHISYCPIFQSVYRSTTKLTDDQFGKLCRQMCAYMFDGDASEREDDVVNMLVAMAIPNLDNMRMNIIRGAKGGRPKRELGGETQVKTQVKTQDITQDKTQVKTQVKTQDKTEKEKEKEIEKEKEMENEIEKEKDTKGKPATPIRHQHGQYRNVLLSDDEYAKLQSEFGKYRLDDMIERLSGYIASKGVTYKNFSATIRNWFKRDAERKGYAPQQSSEDDHPPFGSDEDRKARPWVYKGLIL